MVLPVGVLRLVFLIPLALAPPGDGHNSSRQMSTVESCRGPRRRLYVSIPPVVERPVPAGVPHLAAGPEKLCARRDGPG